MSDSSPTEKRLERIQARIPAFPFAEMRLVRMAYHLQKALRDRSNALLRKYELGDTHYMVLAVLYGSADETATATELSDACNEKPANLTRVCDELVTKGLITRGAKAGDRRAVMISMSGHGRELIERIFPEVSADVASTYADFTCKELEQLTALTARVLKNLATKGPVQAGP